MFILINIKSLKTYFRVNLFVKKNKREYVCLLLIKVEIPPDIYDRNSRKKTTAYILHIVNYQQLTIEIVVHSTECKFQEDSKNT